MITAVDTSVILAVFKREKGWKAWSAVLRRALAEGPLLASPIVYAEISIGFESTEKCIDALRAIGIEYSGFEPQSTWLAGQVFARYRNQGGPRKHLIPDFLIAAHAMTQADRIAAIDRGYLRRYFGDLELLAP